MPDSPPEIVRRGQTIPEIIRDTVHAVVLIYDLQFKDNPDADVEYVLRRMVQDIFEQIGREATL